MYRAAGILEELDRNFQAKYRINTFLVGGCIEF